MLRKKEAKLNRQMTAVEQIAKAALESEGQETESIRDLHSAIENGKRHGRAEPAVGVIINYLLGCIGIIKRGPNSYLSLKYRHFFWVIESEVATLELTTRPGDLAAVKAAVQEYKKEHT